MNNVPKPWTPATVTENEQGVVVKVWGREYAFGNEIFPVSIKASDEELLASPIRLVGEEGSDPSVWKNKEIWVQEKSDREVVICAAQESDRIIVSSNITVSFDGYMHFSVKIVPTGMHPRAGFDVKWNNEKRRIDKLWLEIPFKKEAIILSSCGGWNIGVKSGFSQEGFIPFAPQNWYGNDRTGLGIYFDSDKYWQPKDRNSACERFVCEDAYTVRYRLLDSYPYLWEQSERTYFSPADISKKVPSGVGLPPLTYEFAIQATPVKPYDKSFLKEHIIHIDCFDKVEDEYAHFLLETPCENGESVLERLKRKGVTTVVLHQAWNRIQGYWRLGVKDSARIRKLIEEIHKKDIKVLFYFSSGISTLRPVSEEYMELNRYLKYDGQPMVSFYRMPPQRIVRTCAKSPDTYNDLTNGMVEFLKEYGGDGVYIDSADIPWECTNSAHGCGYTDELGVKHATYPINAMRKALQKIYEEIHEKLGKTVQHHPANAFIPAFHAYCDLVWNGEQVAFKFKTNTKALFEALDEGFMRTEMIGTNIGVPIQFLAYDLPDGSWDIKKALSVTAPFGIYPRPINVNNHLDFMSDIWKTLDEFDPAECEFKGFYCDDIGVKADNENVRVSLYTGKNNVVLISNPNNFVIENCEISGCYEAEKEMISGEVLRGNCFNVKLEPFEVKFVKCK